MILTISVNESKICQMKNKNIWSSVYISIYFKLENWCWMYKSCSHRLSALNHVAALALYLGCGKNSSVKTIRTFIMQIAKMHVLNFWVLNLSASGVHCVNRLPKRMLGSWSKRLEIINSSCGHHWSRHSLSSYMCGSSTIFPNLKKLLCSFFPPPNYVCAN